MQDRWGREFNANDKVALIGVFLSRARLTLVEIEAVGRVPAARWSFSIADTKAVFGDIRSASGNAALLAEASDLVCARDLAEVLAQAEAHASELYDCAWGLELDGPAALEQPALDRTLSRMNNLCGVLKESLQHSNVLIFEIQASLARLPTQGATAETELVANGIGLARAERVERIGRTFLEWVNDPHASDVSAELFLVVKDGNRRTAISLTIQTCSDGLQKAIRQRCRRFGRCIKKAWLTAFSIAIPYLVTDVLAKGWTFGALWDVGGITFAISMTVFGLREAHREWQRQDEPRTYR